MTETEFNQLYLLHHPTVVQTLMQSNADFETRTETAMQLATKGYPIDVPIMLWQWSAFKVMTMRSEFGYTWVPSALMPPVILAPGVSQPGATPYDPAHPPLNAIKVSLDPNDYPPFVVPPPMPIPPLPPITLVGVSMGAGYWQALGKTLPDGTVLKNGDPYKDPNTGNTLVYHESHSWSSAGNAANVVRWFYTS